MGDTGGPFSIFPVQRLSRRLLGGEGLSGRSRTASFWTIVNVGGVNALRLGSNLILTRLLSPDIFGIVALALVFLEGLTMLSDAGIRASVVRSDRGEDPAFLRTAWTIQVLRGLVIAMVACALAWPLSRIYEEPLLFPLLCCLSLTAVFVGFSSISVDLVSRRLMLKNLVLSELAVQIMGALITITAAWLLRSAWALVIGIVTSAALRLAMTHVVLPPFAHRFQLERPALQEIVVFGRWILLGTACSYLAVQGQQAVYGLLVPVELLGKIYIAILMAGVPLMLLNKLMEQVIFPSFSEIRRERPHDIPRILRRARGSMSATFLPAMILISLLAQPVVDLLYDDRYALAGVFLALISLNNLISMLNRPYQKLFLAEGDSRTHALLMALAAVLSVGGIFLGYCVYGIVGSVAFVGLAFSIQFLVNSVVAWRRGYGTLLLDLIVLGMIGLFYLYTLLTLDIPESLLPMTA